MALSPDQAAAIRQLFGPDEASLVAHSPLNWVQADHPPLLLIDSEDDEPLCRESFKKMRSRLESAGGGAPAIDLPGLGHNEIIVRMRMDEDPLLRAVLPFIEGRRTQQ